MEIMSGERHLGKEGMRNGMRTGIGIPGLCMKKIIMRTRRASGVTLDQRMDLTSLQCSGSEKSQNSEEMARTQLPWKLWAPTC